LATGQGNLIPQLQGSGTFWDSHPYAAGFQFVHGTILEYSPNLELQLGYGSELFNTLIKSY
jgi:hypothetical protein